LRKIVEEFDMMRKNNYTLEISMVGTMLVPILKESFATGLRQFTSRIQESHQLHKKIKNK
jgi:hypothetical protein